MLKNELENRAKASVTAVTAKVNGIIAVLFEAAAVRLVRGYAAQSGAKNPEDLLFELADAQEEMIQEIERRDHAPDPRTSMEPLSRIVVVCEGETLASRNDAETVTDWLIPVTVFSGLNLRVGDPTIHGYANPSRTFRPIGSATRCVESDMAREEAVPVELFDPRPAYEGWLGDAQKADVLCRKAADGFWKWNMKYTALRYTAVSNHSIEDRVAALAGEKQSYRDRLGRQGTRRGRSW